MQRKLHLILFKAFFSAGLLALLITFSACNENPSEPVVVVDNNNDNDDDTDDDTDDDDDDGGGNVISVFEYSDDFDTNEDQLLSEREWTNGIGYADAQTDSFTVIAAENWTLAGPDLAFEAGVTPNAYWMLPDISGNTETDYRSVMTGHLGHAQFSTIWLGVRHNGEFGGEEDTYAIGFRGPDAGAQLELVRRNGGETTQLAVNETFSSDNGVGTETPVQLELQVVTDGDTVVLNAWATVEGGDRIHAFENVVDDSADRITVADRPAYGMSINFGRIYEASVEELDSE